ncbi:P1 family peptidase [Roseomonas sp. KE0001]|uniref:P1 family peptidase n=1 Tax=unclassified Roseomonas TaxID=2617492 RepID=UPI0018DF3DC4|nr:P1 family peptidase [Roseomonas sp. KE0001]MBI0434559.1 peptidase S58 family protein [Roseomonas sp. KE0001]
MCALNLLTDIPGVSVGHATDLRLGSGVTAILFDEPAVAAARVSGGAPGSRDVALLSTEASMERVDGFVLSGGSTFGLDAAGGVQAALREAGRGQRFAGALIPLAPQAILFDLVNGGDKDWGRLSPYLEMGYQAARAARPGAFALGTVGAGTGATTATVKGGLGSASALAPDGTRVGAIVAVNAVGNPLVGDGPWFWAAPFEQGDEFGGLGLPPRLSPGQLAPRLKGGTGTATTIGAIVTDATLTKAQLHRLAVMADDGLARALLPAHGPNDGDTVFAAATGARPAGNLTVLGQVATAVMARAIARGVHAAAALPYPGALPAWADRFAGHGR